jgi:hypothetical protein
VHDGAYYDQQRRALLRKHGSDLEDTTTGTKRHSEVALDDEASSILTWRERNRKKLAYSVVGTNNYMVLSFSFVLSLCRLYSYQSALGTRGHTRLGL